MTDTSKFPPHPAAQAFPLMEGEAYDRHREDVRANGLRIPIVLAKHDAQWMILDGRNRQRACDETGRKPRYEYFEGDLEAAIAYAVSVNVARRHLNESQRGLVAARLANLPRGANQHAQICAPSQAEAAELLNVGRRSVQSARQVLEDGEPELVKAVESGDVAVSRAAEIARLNRDQQLDALEEAKNSTPTRQTKEQRDGMMSVSLLLTESDLIGLRSLCEAGEWFAEREPRARHGVKVLRKLAPQVSK